MWSRELSGFPTLASPLTPSGSKVKPEVSADVERGQEKGLEREADQGLFTHNAHQKLCGTVEECPWPSFQDLAVTRLPLEN